MADTLVERAVAARRESRYIEFKELFDVRSAASWCEVLKDIVALANSGGGVILFGVDNKGTPISADVSGILSLDLATICDKIHSYTETHFSDVQVLDVLKGSVVLAALKIGPACTPLVFTRPGTYAVVGGKQQSAFSQGTVYFRHGAKSEPGNSEDLRSAIERRREETRKAWLSGVRKVVHAPSDHRIAVLPPGIRDSDDPSATPVRIVTDESVPGYRLLDPNVTHPLRQKDVIAGANARLGGPAKINQYDILAIRRVHSIDGNRGLCYKPRFAPPQYSDRFVDWILKKFKDDRGFFEETRNAFKKGPA